MRKKIFNILLIAMFSLIVFAPKANASNIVSTDKQVNSGSGNVTISITSKQPLGAYNLELIDSAGLELVSSSAGASGTANGKKISGASATGVTELGSYTFKIPNVTKDTTYTIKFRATGMADVNDADLPNADNNAILTVKAPKEETPTVPDNNNSNSSSNSNNSSTNNNTTNNTTPKTKSSEARLRDLGLNPKQYDFKGFKSDTYEYNIEVPNEASKVYVYATPKDSNATIKSGEGNVSLKEGENKVEVVVTAEDGKTKKTYVLNITRKEAESNTNPSEETPTTSNEDNTSIPNDTVEKIGLSSLTIENLSLNKAFDTNVYEYSAELTENINSLKINAVANNGDADITITGNDNLKNGENIITIEVSNSTGEEKATYKIVVNKNVAVKEEENNNIVAKVDWLRPQTWQTKQYIIVTALGVLVLIIIIALIIKIKLLKEDEDELELPGGEELDKAILEHQEISNHEYDEDEEETDENIQKKYEMYQQQPISTEYNNRYQYNSQDDNDNKNEEKEEYKGNSRIYKDESRREALDEYLAGYKGDSKPKGKHF